MNGCPVGDSHSQTRMNKEKVSEKSDRDLGKHWLGVSVLGVVGDGGWSSECKALRTSRQQKSKQKMSDLSVFASSLWNSSPTTLKCGNKQRVTRCVPPNSLHYMCAHWVYWGKMYSLEEACWYKIPNPVFCLPVWNCYSWGEWMGIWLCVLFSVAHKWGQSLRGTTPQILNYDSL